MPSFFITGTSRGIGLALVEELLKDPQNFVIATARNPSGSKGLQALSAKFSKDRLALVPLDTSKPEQITQAAKEVEKLTPNGLDYLVNNAGISLQPLATFEELKIDLFAEELLFNTVPILNLLREFKPLIAKSATKKVVTITSELGSIELGGGRPDLANAYSVGKAALNMLIRKWGASHHPEGIINVLIHPGWVDTELGNDIDPWLQQRFPGIKPISVETSVQGVIKVAKEAKLEDAVPFFNYDGKPIPW